MKLIICIECDAIINLSLHLKSCTCGDSGGHYIDSNNAIIYGPCIAIGINNESFSSALPGRNLAKGIDFKAWIMGNECLTIVHKTKGDFFDNN